MIARSLSFFIPPTTTPSSSPSVSLFACAKSYCFWGHSGPYCTVCLPKFFPGVLGNCEECTGGTTHSYLILFGMVAGVLAIGGLIYWFKPHKRMSEATYVDHTRKNKKRQAPAFVAINLGCFAFLLHTALVTCDNNRYRRVKNLAKILFVFLQILCSVPVLFGMFFPDPMDSLVSVLGIPALSLPVATVVGCVVTSTDYYDQLLATTLFPVQHSLEFFFW